MRTTRLSTLLDFHYAVISNQTANSIQIEAPGDYVAQEIYYKAVQLGYSGYYRGCGVVLFDPKGDSHVKN